MRTRNIITWIGVIGILALILMIAAIGKSQTTGNLQIDFNTPDQTGLVATLNNKPFLISGLRASYELKAGNYHLVVNKPGYTAFATDFSVSHAKTTTVNVTLTRSFEPTLTTSDQIDIPDVTISNITIINTVYFYDKTWAFVKIRTADGNNAHVVVRYDDVGQKWEVMAGPGTIFSQTTLAGVPSDVVDYIQQNGYIMNG